MVTPEGAISDIANARLPMDVIICGQAREIRATGAAMRLTVDFDAAILAQAAVPPPHAEQLGCPESSELTQEATAIHEGTEHEGNYWRVGGR